MVFDISNPFGQPSITKKVIKGKPKGFKKVTWGMSKISTPERYTAPRTGGGGGRLKKISRNKITSMQWSINNDPTIVHANKLLAELGKPKIGMNVTRRRRGRYNVSLTGDPVKAIENYNKQKTLIDWGKKVGGLALDPKRKVSVVATSTPRTGAHTWCHNNRCRTTGYSTVYDKTYKDVLATSRPKGERWDMLVGKLEKEADTKKARYVKLYKPLDVDLREKLKTAQGEDKTQIENQLNYVRYSYYGIADKELTESEKYKTNLITGIKQTDAVTDDMKRGINKTPDDIKTDEQYKKMLLSELEKEYDKEQAEFEQTAKEVKKRDTVFAQSSAVTRPNRRIVQLASKQSQSITRPTQPEMAKRWTSSKNETNTNTPASAQRGQGFKRFQKW